MPRKQKSGTKKKKKATIKARPKKLEGVKKKKKAATKAKPKKLEGVKKKKKAATKAKPKKLEGVKKKKKAAIKAKPKMGPAEMDVRAAEKRLKVVEKALAMAIAEKTVADYRCDQYSETRDKIAFVEDQLATLQEEALAKNAKETLATRLQLAPSHVLL